MGAGGCIALGFGRLAIIPLVDWQQSRRRCRGSIRCLCPCRHDHCGWRVLPPRAATHRSAAKGSVQSSNSISRRRHSCPPHIDTLDFHLFSQGSSTINNVMSGPLYGMQTMVFGYSYTTGSGKNRRTTRQSVVLVESDELDSSPVRHASGAFVATKLAAHSAIKTLISRATNNSRRSTCCVEETRRRYAACSTTRCWLTSLPISI